MFLIDSLQKAIKKLDDAIFSNDNILFLNEDPGNVTIFSNEMDFLVQIFMLLTLMTSELLMSDL